MVRIGRAYLFEMYKAIHFPYTLLGPVLVLLVVLCAPLLYPVARDGVSDYGFIAYVTPLALNFLGFLMLLIYCAGLVSTESGNGTVRQALLRPLHRYEYVLAKLLNGMTYALILTLVVSVSSWMMVFVLGDLVGVNYGGELLYSKEEMSLAYMGGMLLSLAPQWAGVSFALLLSTLTRSPLVAASAATGIWIVLDLVKHPLHIAPYLFTTYLEQPWSVFIGQCDGLPVNWFPMVWYCLASSMAVFFGCAGGAVWVVQRRNYSA